MSPAARLIEGLRRQQEMYLRLASLVEAQGAALGSMDVDGILGLIERKRAILSDVARFETELAPFKADWASVRSALSAEERRAVDATLEATQRVLSDLVRREDEGRASLERQGPRPDEALGDLLRQGRARDAYRAL